MIPIRPKIRTGYYYVLGIRIYYLLLLYYEND